MENPTPDKTTEKTKDTEQPKTTDLLNPMSGYVQHTNPNLPYNDVIPNLLLQMKADAKSDYSIKFTRKSLTYIRKYAPLTHPEAEKPS